MGAMFRVFSPVTMLHLQDATGDSNYLQTERISKIWIARDYYGCRRMLRGDYHSTNSRHRQKNRDWSTNKKHGGSPAVPEVESFSKGRGGPVSSGRGWGGTGGWGGGKRSNQDVRGSSESVLKDKSHITCYGCNKKGQYRSECPEAIVRIARISSPKPSEKFRKEGSVTGCQCSFIMDTGADITAVLATFIPDCQYTGELFDVKVANDKHEQWKVAKVKMKLRGIAVCVRCVYWELRHMKFC